MSGTDTIRTYAQGRITRELVERTDPRELRAILLRFMRNLEDTANGELRKKGLDPIPSSEFIIRCERHGE